MPPLYTSPADKPTLLSKQAVAAPVIEAITEIAKSKPMMNGRGSLTSPNGNAYEGEFLKDQWHGNGTLTYADGATYEGQYQDGKRHGNGKYTSAEGVRYEGQYADGMWHGRGKITWPDGTVKDAYFEKNRFLYTVAEKAEKRAAAEKKAHEEFKRIEVQQPAGTPVSYSERELQLKEDFEEQGEMRMDVAFVGVEWIGETDVDHSSRQYEVLFADPAEANTSLDTLAGFLNKSGYVVTAELSSNFTPEVLADFRTTRYGIGNFDYLWKCRREFTVAELGKRNVNPLQILLKKDIALGDDSGPRLLITACKK